MALTPAYENANTLKKLTVGGATYFLKDADLRKLVESFGSVVYKDVVTTFNAEGADIATEKAIADYIKDQVAGLQGAMHFVGVTGERTEGDTDLQVIAKFYATKGTTPKAGDVILIKDNSKEYICAVGGESATWEEVGDQVIYLTIAKAAATYTPMTRTVAGKALDHDITVEELSGADALNLKALAHKDSASGQVDVIDTIDNITVGKAGAYDVTGQTTVDVAQTFSALDVTPTGKVTVAADKAASATYQKTTSATISAANATEDTPANYTPAGDVSLPNLTATVALTAESVDTVTDKGTAYTLTDGEVKKADDSASKFVKKGVSFAVNEDEEALTLSYVANTDADFYGDAVTTVGAVSYTAPKLSGSLPTFGTKEVAAKTGATATAAYDGKASFTGTGVVMSAALGYTADAAAVTQPTFTAEFAGDTKSVTPTAATTAAVAQAGGKITVAEQDTAITHTTKKATVTVQ